LFSPVVGCVIEFVISTGSTRVLALNQHARTQDVERVLVPPYYGVYQMGEL
jgi:hypothetical protein